MIDDFFDFIKFLFIFLLGILFILLIFVSLYYFSGCYAADKAKEKEVKECFMQEPKTKECEYILWKYELDKTKKQNNNSSNFTNGMILGTVMAGGMRR